MNVHNYTVRTILIGADVLIKLQIEHWSMVIQWDTVPKTMPSVAAIVKTRAQTILHVICFVIFSLHWQTCDK
jgi:hypothetical protein